MGRTATNLVLLGAGHAHVAVLRRAAIRPIPGAALTLVTREPRAAYSGMLPGLLRGDYGFDDAHIACAPLAAAAGARLLIAEADGIDRAAGMLRLAGQSPLPFDLLSIDVGGRPAMPPGGGVPVKPVGRLLAGLAALEARLITGDRVAVIGAGAGGCELALALAHRLGSRTRVVLIGRDRAVLPGAPARAQAVVRRALAAAGIDWLGGVDAGPLHAGELALSDGRVLALAEAFWATGVVGPGFLAAAGLPCDAAGCLRVDATLRSTGDARVFAAGDCAALEGNARPKAGVWAVRAGPILEDNLRRAVAGQPLRRWRPQRDALVIMSLGNGRAVAWRNGLSVSGRLAWHWKDHLDRKWMRPS
jgi:selenide,water dikinase